MGVDISVRGCGYGCMCDFGMCVYCMWVKCKCGCRVCVHVCRVWGVGKGVHVCRCGVAHLRISMSVGWDVGIVN